MGQQMLWEDMGPLEKLAAIRELADKFGVEFSQEAIERMESVGDLIRYVESDLLRDRPVIIPPSIAPSGHQW